MKNSRLVSLLGSANEKLADRKIMRRYTAGILTVGAALRFAWVFFKGSSILPTEAFCEAAAFATRVTWPTPMVRALASPPISRPECL